MWPFKKNIPNNQSQSSFSSRYFPRNDSWSNFLTGLGMAGYDKRMATQIQPVTQLTEDDLNNLYRGEGLAWRIIDVLTEDMTRKHFTITGDTDKLLEKELRKFKGFRKISECVRWALLHGGSIGVVGIDDGNFLDEPVNESNINAITHIHVYDRWRIHWTSSDLYKDPENPKYGTPEFYTIYPVTESNQPHPATTSKKQSLREQYYKGQISGIQEFRVHETRVLRFDGKLISDKDRLRNNGWNDSYLLGVYERLKGLGESYYGLEVIISEFMQGVLSIQGLANMIAGGQEQLAIKRLNMIDQTRHILNTLLMDSEEEYKRDFANVSGLSDVMHTLMLGVSSSSGIPVTRLFGESPAGLNATGESDMTMYYDKIISMQTNIMQEPVETLIRYVMLSKPSSFSSDIFADWELKFQELKELTEKEKAELRKTQAETDSTYISSGVLDPEEVALSRFGGETYSTETVIDKNIKRGLNSEDEE